MFRGGNGGNVLGDVDLSRMNDEEFKAFLRDHPDFFSDDLHADRFPSSHPGPFGIRNTGNVQTIRQWIDESGGDMTAEERMALERRIRSMTKIDEISEKAARDIAEGKPGKTLPTLVSTEEGFMLDGVHLPDYQRSSNGCWSCAYQLLLQSRGVYLSQYDVRDFRPSLSVAEAYEVEFEAGDTASVVSTMNEDRMSNPYESPDLLLRTVPNCSMHSLSISSYRGAGDYADMRGVTKDQYLDHTVDLVRQKLTEAILDQHSPVALLVGDHYVTVVGIEGNDILIKNSLGPEKETDPDKTYRRNLRDYLSGITTMSFSRGIELNWLSDIHIAKDERTIYGIPENGVHMGEGGVLEFDPEVTGDRMPVSDFRDQLGLEAIPRRLNVRDNGISAVERAYLPMFLNERYLIEEARARSDEDEAMLRGFDAGRGVHPAPAAVAGPAPVQRPADIPGTVPASSKTEPAPVQPQTPPGPAPVQPQTPPTPAKPVTSLEDFTDELMGIFTSYTEKMAANSAFTTEQEAADPAAALNAKLDYDREKAKFFFMRNRLLYSAAPEDLDKVLRQALTPEQYETFDKSRKKAIETIVSSEIPGSISAKDASMATARYIPSVSQHAFPDEETSRKVIEEMYKTLTPEMIEGVLNDVRSFKEMSQRPDRYDHLIESQYFRLIEAFPKDADGKAALARDALTRANTALKGLSKRYSDQLMSVRNREDGLTTVSMRAKAAQTAREFEQGRYDGLFAREGSVLQDVTPEKRADVEALEAVDTSLSQGFGESVGRMMHKMEEMFASKSGEVFNPEEKVKAYAFRNLFRSEAALIDAVKEIDKKVAEGKTLTDEDYDRITSLEAQFSRDRGDILALADEVGKNFSSVPFTEPGNVDITRTPGALAEFAEDKSLQARINGIYSCFAFCKSNGISIDDFLKDPMKSIMTTSIDRMEATRITGIIDPEKSVGANLAAIANRNATEPINTVGGKRYAIAIGAGRSMDGIISGETDPEISAKLNLVASGHNDLMAIRGIQLSTEDQLYTGADDWTEGQKELFMEFAVREPKDISYTRVNGAEFDRNGVRNPVQSLDDYITDARVIDYGAMARRLDANLDDFRKGLAEAGDNEDQAIYIQSLKDKMILGAQEGFIRTLELRREKDRTRTDYRELEKTVRTMADKYAKDLSPLARQSLIERVEKYDLEMVPLERRDNTMVRDGSLHITSADTVLLKHVKENLDHRSIPGLSKYKKDIESLDFSLLATIPFLPTERQLSTASGVELKLLSDEAQKMLEPHVRKYHDVAEKILADRDLMKQQPALEAYLSVIKEYTESSLSDRPDALDSWNSPLRKFQFDIASSRLDIPVFGKDDYPSLNPLPKYAILKGSAELFEMEKTGAMSGEDPTMYTQSAWSQTMADKAHELGSFIGRIYPEREEILSADTLKTARESIETIEGNYASGHTADAISLREVTYHIADKAFDAIDELYPEDEDLDRLSPEARKVVDGVFDLERKYKGAFGREHDSKQAHQTGEELCGDVTAFLSDLKAYRENASGDTADPHEKELIERISAMVDRSDIKAIVGRVDEQYHLEKKVMGAELSDKLTPFYEMMKDTKEGWFGHGNSQEYRDMMSTLERVIALSKRAEASMKNPAVSPLSAGERKALESGLKELDKTCDKYLAGKEKERSTETGKDRYTGALGVLSLINPDKAEKHMQAANEIRKTKISFKQLSETAQEKREERKKRERAKTTEKTAEKTTQQPVKEGRKKE